MHVLKEALPLAGAMKFSFMTLECTSSVWPAAEPAGDFTAYILNIANEAIVIVFRVAQAWSQVPWYLKLDMARLTDPGEGLAVTAGLTLEQCMWIAARSWMLTSTPAQQNSCPWNCVELTSHSC